MSENLRVNEEIREHRIRVVDADGSQLGVMPPDRGMALAKEAGLDLVEVAPNSSPPVCKLMDYGRHCYERNKAVKNRQKPQKVKTIKLRPATEDSDLETKFNQVRKFLGKGHKVRVVMQLRGREAAYADRWSSVLSEKLKTFTKLAELVQEPQFEGRSITAVLEPA